MSGQALEPIPAPDRVIPLYAGVPAGSEHWTWKERTIYNPTVGLEFTQNVVRPELLYFAPDGSKASGTAVIVAPGGGGVNLTIRFEGTRPAQALSRAGAAVFILKYRLVAHPDGPLSMAYRKSVDGVALEGPQKGQNVRALAVADARAAVGWVRGHAAEFHCDPHRIGFMGFSAGGDLACQAIVGPPGTRPDFAALIYGAADIRPDADAPPLFLAVALDDGKGTDAALALFNEWRALSRPAELHVFQMGGHGFLRKGGGGDRVLDRVVDWMQANGWLARQDLSR